MPLADYDFVLADPPYSASDAERYGTMMVNRNKVVRTLSEGLRPGAYLAWLDQVYPMFTKVAAEARGGDRDRGLDQPSVPRADGVPPS